MLSGFSFGKIYNTFPTKIFLLKKQCAVIPYFQPLLMIYIVIFRPLLAINMGVDLVYGTLFVN